MSNDEYRAEQAERRQHGLKARHELRLENATYTAADVKVLTEAALRLGRKEALEEAAAKADELAEGVANPHKEYNEAFIHACGCVARAIRNLAKGETICAGYQRGRSDAAVEFAEVCLGQRIVGGGGPLDEFAKGWNGCAINLSEMARDITKGDTNG